MHRSRLSTLLIDVPTESVPASAAFWSQALGTQAKAVPGEPQFTSLPSVVQDLVVAVQGVEDTPRYHLDIETDDVDAETDRLLGLGAESVASWQGCRTLRAPGGHLLCVIPKHSEEFDRLATTWP